MNLREESSNISDAKEWHKVSLHVEYFVALGKWFMSQDAARWLGDRRRLPGTSISRLGLGVTLTSWCPPFFLKMHLLLVIEWHFLVMEVVGVSIKLEWSCTMFNGSVTYIMSLVQRLPFDLVLGIYSSIPIWSKHIISEQSFFSLYIIPRHMGYPDKWESYHQPKICGTFWSWNQTEHLFSYLLCKAASRV